MRLGLLARLLMIVGLAIVPCILALGYMQWELHRSRVADVEEHATRLLSAVIKENQRVASRIRLRLANMVGAETVPVDDGPACQAYVQRYVQLMPSWQIVEVADRTGRIACSTDRSAVGADFSHYPHLEQALASGGFAAGTYDTVRPSGEHGMPFAMAFRDHSGAVAGAVAVTIGLDWLNDFLNRQVFPANMAVTMVDRQGTILLRHPSIGGLEGSPLPSDQRWMVDEPAGGIVHLTGFDGVPRILAYSPPAANNLGVLYGLAVDAEPGLASIRRTTWEGLALMIGAGLVSLAAAVLYYRLWLRRPFSQMLAVAEAWKLGDTSARLPLDPALAELREVATAFNQVAEAADDRERAQRAADKATAHLRHMVDANIIGVITTDLDGQIWEANDYYLDLLGYSREDLAAGQLRWDALTAPDWMAATQNARDELIRRRVCAPFEKQYVRKDGTRVWVYMSCAMVPDSDTHVLSFILDVDAAKKAEERAQAAREEADRANLSKSKFLAAASHDLRQPVQSLMLFTSALGARLGNHPAGPVVERISASVDTLQTMLDELLDISRLDAAVIEPKRANFTVADLLDRLHKEYAPRAQQKGLELRVVPARLDVHTDPALLERMLRNLIENALRYTKHGGILIGCRRRNKKLRVDVIDTGIGIEHEHFREIFDEFYQVGNPGRDRRLGLGLGLSIVKRLSQILRLPVSVASARGKGSRFSILLPLATRHQTPEAKATHAAARRLTGLFLVVDDDPMIREALAFQLEAWGAEVRMAESAEEAIALLKVDERAPDVVIADYRLGGGRTGVQAVDEIAEAIGQAPRTFILTADTDPERMLEVRRRGYQFLHKPISSEGLQLALMPEHSMAC